MAIAYAWKYATGELASTSAPFRKTASAWKASGSAQIARRPMPHPQRAWEGLADHRRVANHREGGTIANEQMAPLFHPSLSSRRIDNASHEQDRPAYLVADQEQERVIRRNVGTGCGGAAIAPTITPVAAAASVPTSFTSTNALWTTAET